MTVGLPEAGAVPRTVQKVRLDMTYPSTSRILTISLTCWCLLRVILQTPINFF